jgi:tetratricopeptide (TPR) repeat protein
METGNAREAVRELRYIAQEHEKTGNLSAMVQAMRQISQAVPANVEMKAKLIEGYLRRGVLDEAIVELDLIGELYRDRNRTADAVAAFTRAAEIASATGAFARGNALFQKAVEANPDDVPVRHAAVAFYLQTGSIGQAAAQLREVVRIALVTEDRDEAVAALHQIIALAPQDSDAYHQLGEVLTSLGEYTQAERVYRRLATFSPHDLVLEAKQSALAVLAATK